MLLEGLIFCFIDLIDLFRKPRVKAAKQSYPDGCCLLATIQDSRLQANKNSLSRPAVAQRPSDLEQHNSINPEVSSFVPPFLSRN